MLSSKSNIKYSKACAKSKCVCFIKSMWLIINYNENEAENEKMDHIDTYK